MSDLAIGYLIKHKKHTKIINNITFKHTRNITVGELKTINNFKCSI